MAAFHPDVLLLVHGRRFARTWSRRLRVTRNAAWITEATYEADDTSAWSTVFDTVFVNDPGNGPRQYRLDLNGAYSALHERCLVELAQAGLLSVA